MERTLEADQLEQDLKRAIVRKEFRLFYQPKIDLITGIIIGVEALIRWEHPSLGVMQPIEFIPLAEESGLIIPLGEWVLREACLQHKAWQKKGLPPLTMSVNLSAGQLYQTDFADQVNRILEETNLAPEYLSFEITEGKLLDPHHGPKVLAELRRLGVKISLDDFGTGFNSLLSLQELPIDKIKIDQSFVQNCHTDLNNATIVKSIIEMAHQLKMVVIAEGIEHDDQLVFLQQNLCNAGQGYLFSEPLSPDELMKKFHKIEQVVNREGIPPEGSHQKLNQEMLKNARQDLRDTIRLQHGMIFKYTKINGKFIHTVCDGKLFYRLGANPQRLIGRELRDILPEVKAEVLTQYYQKAWQGEENVTFELELYGIFLIISLSPIRRGGVVTKVIGSAIDITEQKRAEKALRLKESQFRAIIESTQDLIRVIDTNNILEYASPSHETILGFPPEAYEGKLIFDMMHPNDHARIKKLYSDTVKAKKSIQTELRLKHVNGGWVDFEVKVSPVLDEQDEVKHLIILARDISERKRTEHLMSQSEKLTIVSLLAISVAHEIRNPLTTIKGFVQLLQKEVDKPLYLETMQSEITRLEEIVSGFLSFNRSQVKQLRKTDPKSLVHQALRIVEPQLQKNKIELAQEFDPDLRAIDCDENQIKQVFVHILRNAMEAMPNGGTIKVQIQCKGRNHIKISMIDEGYGITEERLLKIGEPFYSTKEKGTGLGLMLCHKIIDEHGGWIDIDSVVNQGTQVDVILPIKQEHV